MHLFTTFVSFAVAVSAITITSPARDDSARPVAYNNGTFTITWSSVSTDPEQLNILLSTNNGQSTSVIAQNVKTSDDKYAVDLTGLSPGENYAVNLAPSTLSGSSGILAQSGTFTIEQGTIASSSSSAVAAATSSATSSQETSSTSAPASESTTLPASSSSVAASAAAASSSGSTPSSASAPVSALASVSTSALVSGAATASAVSASGLVISASGLVISAVPSQKAGVSGTPVISTRADASGSAAPSGSMAAAAASSARPVTASSGSTLRFSLSATFFGSAFMTLLL